MEKDLHLFLKGLLWNTSSGAYFSELSHEQKMSLIAHQVEVAGKNKSDDRVLDEFRRDKITLYELAFYLM